MLEAWFFRLRYRALPVLALAAFACALLLPISIAPALAETRTLKLYNTHTHERVSITFKRNGRYISEGLRDLNRFLRDWRRNEITKMDPELFDLVWEVYQAAGTGEAIHVVSGYRSPATNNMLRSRSRGVAKSSQHTRGRAMDFYIPGVSVAKLRALGLRKEVGGVGFYPTSRSPFVHMDTGSVRHWPRMTRSQLAKVFPRGDTIHVPTDGKKMPGYAQALARHKSGASSRPTAVASASSPSRPLRPAGELAEGNIRAPLPGSTRGGPGLLARIFGGDEDEGEDTGASPTPPAAVRSTERTQVASATPAPPPVPSQAPPGVRAAEPAPQPEAVPDPVVVAQLVPQAKPAGFSAIVAAATAGAVAPGTLEAQAQRLANGLPPVDQPPTQTASVLAPAQPVAVASAPLAKPAELRQGPLGQGQGGNAVLASMVPRPAPADGVSAIAAATGATQPSAKPQSDITGATLAYAPAAVAASASAPVGVPQRRAVPPAGAAKAARASVSGRVPEPVVRDPLARFAALPDRTALPDLISGRTTTRTLTFARLQHPNQRRLELLLAPGGRVFANRFGTTQSAASPPRADRFEGPAVVLLPVFSLQ
ncbi:DUF882 domain-containing protein [Stappia sp.]|uniref:DUF882 domain-containing protein n=1 Tax=Stappia sp. TaxID=1870903 RepID=UPI003D0E49E8